MDSRIGRKCNVRYIRGDGFWWGEEFPAEVVDVVGTGGADVCGSFNIFIVKKDSARYAVPSIRVVLKPTEQIVEFFQRDEQVDLLVNAIKDGKRVERVGYGKYSISG